MRRVAFFAHYDPDGRIDDYVLHYLSELLKAGVLELYFASDCDILDEELAQLPEAVKVVNSTRHGEYDFGSWKRCFSAVNLALDVDELILCNDSCYGPLNGLANIFSKMQLRSCDFWGVTQVQRYNGYYPSYFLAFRRSVLDWSGFYDFFKGVLSFVNKKEFCLKYEVGLTHILRKEGFQGDCFLRDYSHLSHSSAMSVTADVFEAGMPFIRVMTARENPAGIAHLGAQIKTACEMNSSYPLEIIRKHLERTSPGYRKYWSFAIGKSVKYYLGIIRVSTKPEAEVDRCRLKIRIFGISFPSFSIPMRYDCTGDEGCGQCEK